METAVGNSTCVLRVGVVDAAWHMSTNDRRPTQFSSLRLVRGILAVSKVSEPALTSDVPIVHALAEAHYQHLFPCSFFRTYCDCSRYPELAPLGLLRLGPVELSMDVS
jgi:hypothetical protein